MTQNHAEKIRVKVLSNTSLKAGSWKWGALFPGGRFERGRCHFLFDPYERHYDWLLVIHDLPKLRPPLSGDPRAIDTLACPREHTLLVTTEPATVTRYGPHFVRQFARVVTNQEAEALSHPGAIRSQTGNVWLYGRTYDELAAQPPLPKPRLFSTLCSTKQQGHTLHARRYAFTQRLIEAIPELERFGRKFRFVERKADAIEPYAFHLAIENHFAPHHWTEKLADTFLGYAVPIYYGCPNVFDYFPEDSLIPIDIHDFPAAVRIVRQALSPENYARRLPAVIEARRRVMELYNLPSMVSRLIEEAHPRDGFARDVRPARLYNRTRMRARHPQDFVPFALWRIRNYLHGLWINGGKRAPDQTQPREARG